MSKRKRYDLVINYEFDASEFKKIDNLIYINS